MEKQKEFEFAQKTSEEYMKEISADANKQLKIILDEIIDKGYYSDNDFTNIVNQAKWI